jgi:transcriptional adapter 2-alpha
MRLAYYYEVNECPD